MQTVDPSWVQEIPFDVAEWGDRVVAPLWATEEEFQAFMKLPPSEEFQALLAEQQILEQQRLGL